jgi:hypothetical protein
MEFYAEFQSGQEQFESSGPKHGVMNLMYEWVRYIDPPNIAMYI